MSLDIGDLVGYIKLDHTGVGQGVRAAQQEIRQGMTRMSGDAAQQGRKIGQEAGGGIRKGLGNITSDIKGQIAGAFAVGAAVAGLNRLKDAASDLNETTSMAAVIFGQNNKAMQAWAQNAPRNLGIATEEALRTSASFADMFLQIGYGQDAAMGASKEVLQLAADLGSFKNLQTGDVLERLAAGFRGEYDSLQALIPNINAARVESEAMAMTGAKNADSLTAQQKAAATLAIVQKDGARAMGDFARTADGNANASKTAAAEAANLAAELGQTLLPAYTALVIFGRDQVIPFLKSTVGAVETATDALGPLASEVGDVVDTFRGMPAPIQTATVALVAMVAMRSRLEGLGSSVKDKVGGGAKAAVSGLESLRLHLMYASDEADRGSSRIGGYARALGTSAGAGLRGAASGLLGVLGGPWGVAFTAATAAVTFWITKQQDAKQYTDELKASLDAQTGAVTENTRVKVAQRLQEEGLLDRAKELGISIQTVTDAAVGQGDAMNELRRLQADLDAQQKAAAGSSTDLGAALIAGSSGASALGAASGQASDKIAAQAALVGRLIDLLAPTNAALAEQRDKTREVAEAAGTATDSTQDLGGATQDTAQDMDDAADAAKKAAQAILDLHDAQLEASGAQIGYQDALAKVEERLQKRKELEAELAKAGGVSDRTKKLQERVKEEDDPKKRAKLEKDLAESQAKDAAKGSDEVKRIKDELKDYKLTLDITTEAGRRNKDALDDQAKAAKAQAEAMLAAGGGIKDVRKAMAESRADFIENAIRLGASKTEAKAMADQYGLTTKEVDKISEAIDGVPTSKKIEIELEKKHFDAELLALQGRINGLTGKTVSVVYDEVHKVRYVQSGRLTNGGRGTAGGQTVDSGGPDGSDSGTIRMRYDSNGRLVPQADGGYHPARMFSAGDGVQYMFNEPETGGESFIPHAPAKRPGALRVLEQTAELFGLTVQPKSDTRINKTTVIHRGNVIAPDPLSYLGQMDEVAAAANDRSL